MDSSGSSKNLNPILDNRYIVESKFYDPLHLVGNPFNLLPSLEEIKSYKKE
jgi:hypothetical protein